MSGPTRTEQPTEDSSRADAPWTTEDIIHAGLNLLLLVGLGMFGVVEGIAGSEWTRVAVSGAILALCAMWSINRWQQVRLRRIADKRATNTQLPERQQ
jgi:uncharacterized membrane protein YuzA (DUF378 family)